MRLIDADKLKNILTVAEYPCALQNVLIEVADTQPTAYDVDKVVEQMEEEKKRAFELCLAINDKAQRQQYIIKEQAMARAIEIVKAGGIDVIRR